ncbi:unnamed protein product [Phytophthora lilii]|uniref:Unnamed protein product n=1 Tax=Phytophthora lilii TaxID=2077276 RepID=A0A9W6WQ71_9STRA|nr:unnamed protein product [Phytophthora lilii]
MGMSVPRRVMGPKTCTTVFVDDYRYERDIVQTNLVDWYGIISMLRGSAQAYVWIRVALLIYGAYVVVLHPINVIGRLVRAASIVLRIPFEVVVYSSLLPVNAYVIAVLLDGSFMDIYLDSYWASVGGAINFELVAFLQTTAVQMRNVWLLAVLVTVTVLSVRNVREFWSDGSPGIRGHIICFTSTLTIVGPYKNTIFRDTNINATIRVVNKGQTIKVVQGNPIGHYNNSTYLFDYSVIMLIFCIIVVIGVVAILKICGMSTRRGSWIYRETEGIILSSTPIVPIGARRFWLMSILSVQFYLPQYPLTESQPCQLKKRMSWLDTPTILEEPQNHTKVWPFHSQILDNTKTLKQLQESEVGKYSAEYRSVVQLMNISMMTDPWNFFWLRFVGIQLYLYKIRLKSLITFGFCSNSVIQTYATILPFAEDEMEEHTGLTTTEYELLNSASSRDVPITVLIQSG